MTGTPGRRATTLIARRPCGASAFELHLTRPGGFTFSAGQRIRLYRDELERDYSLAGDPDWPHLVLLVGRLPQGRMARCLERLPLGSALEIGGPLGYFTFQPSGRPAVFVATGTGIGPFHAMARAGVGGFLLLHGVRTATDLCYREFFSTHRCTYQPCLSQGAVLEPGHFAGRVTRWLERHALPVACDLYLCGGRDMVRDVTHLADRRWPQARIFSEIFF